MTHFVSPSIPQSKFCIAHDSCLSSRAYFTYQKFDMVECVGLRGRKLQLRQCQCSQSPPAELQTNLMTSGITYGEIDFLLFPALEESTCNLHTPKKVIGNSTFSLLFRKRISKAQFVQSNLVNLRWRQRTMTKKKQSIVLMMKFLVTLCVAI